MLFTSRPNHIQLTLKQHGFELCRSTYIQIFFNSKYYGITQSTAGCNLQMQNLGYGGTLNMEELQIRSADYRLYIDFQLHGRLTPLTAPRPCHGHCLTSIWTGSEPSFRFYQAD